MTSGGFAVDPQAIATAAKAFESQADPIAQQAQKLDGIKGSASTTGRAYQAQGSAYHQAVTSSLDKVVREFSTKTEWVSGALSQAGTDYTSGDQSGQTTIAASGKEL
jgi:uncharacterized protein YukE